ncbi:MAG: hypothetical protein A2Y62_12895 [Candidatus Fischerbacteria bacterium RBG_13_37_8]|uniref:Soluble ligand binding domain-containing protein n=1 Tax=Candidatus Fischerbacteria bacterium RBG_13_37_8 TaxID=1817863 RepID=A0A1F5V5K0_9BACT|nr:MAG: hypothetical protein A2Y62_12895 [Candidatus Fischerbacteria bacterium RBG_13_37_8]
MLTFGQDEQITISKLYGEVEGNGEYAIVIESDKDFDKIKEYYLEGQQYIVDFLNTTCSLSNVNLFDNSFIKELNIWQVQTERLSRVRLSINLKQGKRPKFQISQNTLKIIFGTTLPASSASSQEDDRGYIVGPGDILEITVFENSELSTLSIVPDNSNITIPLVGDVNVSNLTIQEVTDIVTKKLKEYVRFPIVTIKVTEYKSQWVNVVGEVKSPGKYYLKGKTYLLDIISEANGLTEKASSEIVISRKSPDSQEPERIVVRNEDLSVYEDNPSNILLQTGDTITIPAKKYFYIYGEIAHPGSFQLEEGMTILKALTQAGGFTKFASKKSIEILRTDENNKQQKIIVNIKDIEDRKSEDIEIKPEDIIRIPKSIF